MSAFENNNNTWNKKTVACASTEVQAAKTNWRMTLREPRTCKVFSNTPGVCKDCEGDDFPECPSCTRRKAKQLQELVEKPDFLSPDETEYFDSSAGIDDDEYDPNRECGFWTQKDVEKDCAGGKLPECDSCTRKMYKYRPPLIVVDDVPEEENEAFEKLENEDDDEEDCDQRGGDDKLLYTW